MKSQKWNVNTFCYLLDTARINSHTVWSMNHKLNPRKTDSYKFCKEVAMQLIIPFMKARSNHGFSKLVQKKMFLFLPPPVAPARNAITQYPGVSLTPKRRKPCSTLALNPKDGRNLAGVVNQCQHCAKALCKKHYITVCSEFLENMQ